MKNLNTFIYKPLIVLLVFITLSAVLNYFLYFLGINLSFIRYFIYIIAAILSLVLASAGAKEIDRDLFNIKETQETEIEQFEPIVKEINDNNKRAKKDFEAINKSLENLLKTGRDDKLKELSDKLSFIESNFTKARYGGSRWDSISKGISELKEEILKKDKEIEKIKLENKKSIEKINDFTEEIRETKKHLEQKNSEIRNLKDQLEKSKEQKLTIASGSIKITAPKRAANVDAKDFIDFAGRGFGKY